MRMYMKLKLSLIEIRFLQFMHFVIETHFLLRYPYSIINVEYILYCTFYKENLDLINIFIQF